MPKRAWLTAVAFTVSTATLAPVAVARSQTGSTAAPSPAPTQQPCATLEHRQFDFWVGEWVVAGPLGATLGVNRIESILNGCVIQERWEVAGGIVGTSFNLYQQTDKKWHQTWVDRAGNLLVLEGGIKDGKMDMTGTTNRAGKTIQHRVTWEPMGTTKLRQLWVSSPDGGTTWNTVFDGTYTRKS